MVGSISLTGGVGATLAWAPLFIEKPGMRNAHELGIVIHHLILAFVGDQRLKTWNGASLGLSLISDICLGMFLTMALMGLQLWQLSGALMFILCALTLQILLTVDYTYFVVFRFMGRDYEASVIASGFGGIALGSTATAIVNMSTVTQKYGAAHQAFLIVPLVCGFFIDLVNAVIISMFSGL
jgi:ESS family glutamate:Na+ symporter